MGGAPYETYGRVRQRKGAGMFTGGKVLRGHSISRDAATAARELHTALDQDGAALVLFFCSSKYDLSELAGEINRLFGDTPVLGCTTSGELGPAGYQDFSLSGISLPAEDFSAVFASIGDLGHFALTEGQAMSQALRIELESRMPEAGPDNTFAFMMIDGLSIREEQVVRAFKNGIGKIPLFGGSAGDDMAFSRTMVFFDKGFHPEAAVLLLVTTKLPFMIFRTQHFVTEEERLVVTEADVVHRIVKEINGLPAAQEYARLIGAPAAELRPSLFAAWPVVVLIDGTDYVRSIQKVNEDGSLSFFSAIDEGLVLRVARGRDLLGNLRRCFAGIREKIGEPQLVIACDCILRKMEIVQDGLKDAVGEVMLKNAVVGFNTYGEQIDGVHVNQTLTGIAIGGRNP